MKKNLTRFFVAVLGITSAGVVGTLLGSNNNVIETKAEASSAWNFASASAGWWYSENTTATFENQKMNISFAGVGGTAYNANYKVPTAEKEYKVTIIGKSLGDGSTNVNFCSITSWALIKSLSFSPEGNTFAFSYAWPSKDAIGFCFQLVGGTSTSLEISTITFEEMVPHTLTYINSIDYASSTSYWRGDVSLTDDGIKMSRADSDVNVYVGEEENGLFEFVIGKTYTISLEIKTDNMFMNFAINSPWVTIKSAWFNLSEFAKWEYTFTVESENDAKIESALIFQLNAGSGDAYIKNFYVGEVVSSTTFNDGDKLGTLPEVPTKAGYKDGKWNIGNELVSSETEFNYGKDTYAYLTYTDATKEYASNFLDTLTCDGTGSITAEEGYWDNLKAEYARLDDTSKTKLRDSKANTGGNEIQKCVARYDYVVNKYNLENFMNRRTASSSSSNIINTGSTNTILTVAILVSVTLIAGASLILIRKKRA